MELKKQTEEAASKVAAVLRRAEEQTVMIESLHTSVCSLFRNVDIIGFSSVLSPSSVYETCNHDHYPFWDRFQCTKGYMKRSINLIRLMLALLLQFQVVFFCSACITIRYVPFLFNRCLIKFGV